ncbi:MAG: hemerythrin family protein [Tistlia sp.]|uniref:bacteriohemerythrin n=1 Tax=Tistlia sp. TaxID=3057121 RepID=UPI0034A40E9D
MKFELTDAFLTGDPWIDEDHRRLAATIDSIHATERSADPQGLFAVLAAFRAHLAHHFAQEEAHLKAMRYPHLEPHRAHHGEILEALERLMRSVEDGRPVEGGVAQTCYHELIRVVLLRDMQFANWVADRNQGIR